jgi:hypothetical protein
LPIDFSGNQRPDPHQMLYLGFPLLYGAQDIQRNWRSGRKRRCRAFSATPTPISNTEK